MRNEIQPLQESENSKSEISVTIYWNLRISEYFLIKEFYVYEYNSLILNKMYVIVVHFYMKGNYILQLNVLQNSSRDTLYHLTNTK